MKKNGERSVAYLVLVVLVSQFLTPRLEARSFFGSKKASPVVISHKELDREVRLKKNIINAPVHCGVVPGGYSEQLVLEFDRALYYEFDESASAAENTHSFVLKFPNMDAQDFTKLNIKEQFAHLHGIMGIEVSSLQEQGTQKVVLTILYDPHVVHIKIHKAPKAKYVKIDAFSREKLRKFAVDYHNCYQA